MHENEPVGVWRHSAMRSEKRNPRCRGFSAPAFIAALATADGVVAGMDVESIEIDSIMGTTRLIASRLKLE